MILANKCDVAIDAVDEKDLKQFMVEHKITLFK